MDKQRQFKHPNCPAAVTARYAEELKTKRSLITGRPLTQNQLAWRSGVLWCRNYEKNWYNTVNQTYGKSMHKASESKYNDNFIQNDYSNYDFNSLYDDLDNVKLTK